MKKRVLCAALSVLMISTAFTGCGKTTMSSSSSKQLTIWTNMEVEAKALQKMGDEWGKKSGYTVKVRHQSPSVQKFAQAVKSATGPDAVVGIPNDQLADYINANLAMETPKDVFDEKEFSNAAVSACYVDGKKYAMPVSVETNSLFVNTDKIKDVPGSWEDLVKVAKDNGGVQFDATSIYYDLGFVRAQDGYIFKYEDGKYDVKDIGLNTDGAVKAYEFVNSLYKDYKFVSQDVTADIARSNFQNGKTAFYIGGPWDIDGFKSAGTKFKVVEMPKYNGKDFVTPVGTQVSFVSKKTSKSKAAWDFIKYVSSDGAEELYKVGNRIPAKLSEQEKDSVKKDETMEAFIKQINHSEPMPTVSEMGQLWDIHTNNIRSMWGGKLTPKETADNITSQLKEAIKLMDAGK
ncbi:MAG: maltose ABC transporter substrate-binding protein [Lachnospiraceae bacterium]|nr:maltose ABC transporter substrate-binding protein [Lachnospiraceae bacterium]